MRAKERGCFVWRLLQLLLCQTLIYGEQVFLMLKVVFRTCGSLERPRVCVVFAIEANLHSHCCQKHERAWYSCVSVGTGVMMASPRRFSITANLEVLLWLPMSSALVCQVHI